MRKLAFVIYILVSLSLIFFVIAVVAWDANCGDYWIESRRYDGICMTDGMQFVGVFVFSIVAATIYLGLTALVLKLLGYKLTKK